MADRSKVKTTGLAEEGIGMRLHRRAPAVVAILMLASAAAAQSANDRPSADVPKDGPAQAQPQTPTEEDFAALVRVGAMFEHGVGVKQDYAEARKWYLKAAEQDDAKAEFSLGVLCARGRGAPKNYAEAARWFRKAAARGLSAAQFNLGVMYAHSLGVPQDYVLAHVWFNLAASQGEPGAKQALEDLETRMAPAEVSDAARLANGESR
jgi:TPR repeat protein